MKRLLFIALAVIAFAVPAAAVAQNEGQDGGQCEDGYMAAYADHIEYCLEGKLYWIWR